MGLPTITRGAHTLKAFCEQLLFNVPFHTEVTNLVIKEPSRENACLLP